VAAEGPDEIRVDSIEVELVDGWIVVSAESRNLFSRKSLSTLQSGLPAVIRLEIRLVTAAETRSLFSSESDRYEKVLSAEAVQSISYNVWDERYTVRHRGKTEVFPDFPAAEKAVGRTEREPLIAAEELEPMRAYVVQARVQLVPISTEQGDRIADWLRNPHRLQTDMTAESDGGGSQFDIDGLLSVFWERDAKSRNRSGWSSSRSFRIGDSGEWTD